MNTRPSVDTTQHDPSWRTIRDCLWLSGYMMSEEECDIPSSILESIRMNSEGSNG